MLQNVKTISNTLCVMCKLCQMSSYLKTSVKKKNATYVIPSLQATLWMKLTHFILLLFTLRRRFCGQYVEARVINETCRYTDKHLRAFGLFSLAITEQTSTAAITSYVYRNIPHYWQASTVQPTCWADWRRSTYNPAHAESYYSCWALPWPYKDTTHLYTSSYLTILSYAVISKPQSRLSLSYETIVIMKVEIATGMSNGMQPVAGLLTLILNIIVLKCMLHTRYLF